MQADNENPVRIEKAYTLKFLRPNPSTDMDSDKWSWKPVNHNGALGIQTATFSGKNQADDYKNE